MSSGDRNAGSDSGLLLIGHGSQEPAAIEEFKETSALVAALAGGAAVESCFLEFVEPSIAAGFRRLARRGVQRVTAVPVLLFSAGHAQRDIPAALAAVAAEYPRITIEQAEHLGCHQAVLALSELRYQQALAAASSAPDDGTALVLVGRGSRDAQATAEMLEFARLRQERAGAAQTCAAFIAMADPPLARVLDEVAASDCRRVVVQPHMLFAGVLLDRVRLLVEQFARKHNQSQWILAGHLGPSELLAQALLDRAGWARIG